jgi:putative PIN family toxin of toxin-antitoxin system
MIRAVLDVNILVSAILGPLGLPRQVVVAWEAGRFSVATAEGILAQLAEKLSLDRIRKRFNIRSADDIRWILNLLHTQAELTVLPSDELLAVTSDPEDDCVLATGRLAGANYLVTGDRGLLALGRHEQVEIVSPREFLEILRAQERGRDQ